MKVLGKKDVSSLVQFIPIQARSKLGRRPKICLKRVDKELKFDVFDKKGVVSLSDFEVRKNIFSTNATEEVQVEDNLSIDNLPEVEDDFNPLHDPTHMDSEPELGNDGIEESHSNFITGCVSKRVKVKARSLDVCGVYRWPAANSKGKSASNNFGHSIKILKESSHNYQFPSKVTEWPICAYVNAETNSLVLDEIPMVDSQRDGWVFREWPFWQHNVGYECHEKIRKIKTAKEPTPPRGKYLIYPFCVAFSKEEVLRRNVSRLYFTGTWGKGSKLRFSYLGKIEFNRRFERFILEFIRTDSVWVDYFSRMIPIRRAKTTCARLRHAKRAKRNRLAPEKRKFSTG